jgi:glycosidase
VEADSVNSTRVSSRPAYEEEPDFKRPLLKIPRPKARRFFDRLSFLYGPRTARRAVRELVRLLRVHHAYKSSALIEAEENIDPSERFSERDMVLIAYADMVRTKGKSPLAALTEFLEALRRRAPVFNTLHLLPFFPYSSDRGFSITDFHQVDPAMGSWQDIERMGRSFRMMFDGVFNHVSSKSVAFREVLGGNPEYKDFAVLFRSKEELTAEQRAALRRPRTSDILTMFDSLSGPIWAWTTFSPDQIDLNYKNPRVLLRVIDTLLYYVRKGADIVRLDAATYLWDDPGTEGASLPQTHQLIKLFRDALDVAAPGVALVTETNVPHEENVSYFGDGGDEAQMVYNFALPPLVLHAFYRQNAFELTRWVESLVYPPPSATFLNVLDTHDGIGLSGVAGILAPEEIEFLVQRARQHGAFVSYRRGEGGGDVSYEINSTWYSALNLDNSGEDRAFQVKRFVASRSIALALRGVPGIYLHGLIGSRSDVQLALESKVKRDVNRAPLDGSLLMRNLAQPGSKLHHVHDLLGRLLEIRVRHRAFHPSGPQKVLRVSNSLFAVLRASPADDEHVLALTNVTGKPCEAAIPLGEIGIQETNWYDLVSGRGWQVQEERLAVRLQPYDVLWLTPFSELERRIEP